MNFLIINCTFLLLIFVWCANATNQSYNENIGRPISQRTPYIQISNYGVIEGFVSHTAWTKRPIYNYMGLKYGHISYEGRFKLAQPVPPLSNNIYNAVQIPRFCPSFPKLNEISEMDKNAEDCLFLNVHSSNLYGKNPVMFYIHGEFFFDGSADEAAPEYLLEKDIILVSVQYRLGPFGFLSTKTEDIPGNIAVADIVNALNWVRENIINFGGDPNRITIFGQGAGATMAHVLTISPSVDQSLFKNVILQSGSALNPYLLTTDPIKHARGIAKKANCPRTEHIQDLNFCFISLSTKRLLKAFHHYCRSNEQFGIKHYGGFQLSVGDYFGILPQHPAKLTQQDKFHYHPMMGGVTKHVGSHLYTSAIYLQVARARDLDVYGKIDLVLQLIAGIDDEFGLWKGLTVDDLFTEQQILTRNISPGLVDLCSIIVYKAPLLEALQQNAQNHPNETYLYTLDYQGTYNRYNFNKSVLDYQIGVSLSDENIYLFPYPPEVTNLQGDDLKIAKIMIDLWTSFAADGIPKSQLLEIDNFPPMKHINGPYLKINKQLTIGDDFVNEMAVNNAQNISL